VVGSVVPVLVVSASHVYLSFALRRRRRAGGIHRAAAGCVLVAAGGVLVLLLDSEGLLPGRASVP